MGDKNTSFFHKSVIIKNNRRRILSLLDGNSQRISSTEKLKDLALNFFKALYAKKGEGSKLVTKSCFPNSLSTTTAEALGVPTKEEIYKVIKSMHPYKVAGLDGLIALFYQSQ